MLCPYCLVEAQNAERVEEDGISGYRCPNDSCGRILSLAYAQDYTNYLPTVFSLIGLTGHGKTCFLASFLQELDRVGSRWKTFSYTPLDESTMNEVQDKLLDLREGNTFGPTNVSFPEPTILRLDGIPRIGNIQIFLYDNGGEVFINVMRLREFAPYLTRSRVVVWLVSLKDLRHPTELLQLLMVYREGMLALKADPKNQSLVVVLTKADELDEFKDGHAVPESIRAILGEDRPPSGGYGWGQIEVLSRDIERWLEEQAEQANFVRRAKTTFAHVRFCVTADLWPSSTDRQTGGRITPKGVLVPLYWLARLQLPVVQLDRGTGDLVHLSLQDAVDSAPEGATIQLDAAVYHLPEPLVIRRSIMIRGAGSHRTVVMGSSVRNVLEAVGDFRLGLEKIRFEHQGDHWANVATVAVAELSVTDCQFQGAVSSLSDDSRKNWMGGIGLRVGGRTRGLIRGSAMSGNALAGVFFVEEADVLFENSECSDNGRYGLVYHGKTGGEAKRSRIIRNGKVGVMIGQTSSPTLEENTVEAHGLSGFLIREDASPTLIGNRCLANHYGMKYQDRSSGTASGNIVSGSTSDGLVVDGESRPSLESNRVESSAKAGITFRGHSGGSALSNHCLNNRKDGILATDESSPTLTTNRTEVNGGAGIAFGGQATGVADGNVCQKNTGPGILVENEAGPIVSNNQCQENLGAALAYRDRSRGSASQNRFLDNKGPAIDRAAGTWPDLADNRDGQEQSVTMPVPTPVTSTSTSKSNVNMAPTRNGEKTSPARPRWSLFPRRKA